MYFTFVWSRFSRSLIQIISHTSDHIFRLQTSLSHEDTWSHTSVKSNRRPPEPGPMVVTEDWI